jgi:hypothetical protein
MVALISKIGGEIRWSFAKAGNIHSCGDTLIGDLNKLSEEDRAGIVKSLTHLARR